MEYMKNILVIIQIILAILLMASILMQNRGTGLGSAFGGGDNIYRTKRGIEKVLSILSIIFSIIFLALSFVIILI